MNNFEIYANLLSKITKWFGRNVSMVFVLLCFLFQAKAADILLARDRMARDTVFVKGTKIPVAIGDAKEDALIFTPRSGPSPRINGANVYGCRPGNPFIYRIPVTGERPMVFSVQNLPSGLTLNSETGIITGTNPSKGEYNILIRVSNTKGKDKKYLKIIAGEQLALTPPMGWNDWYAHYDRITDKMVREAADILISSGMADVGYQFINIDDCWMNAPQNKDSLRVGPLRDEKGNIVPNQYFQDMKSLTNYIHSKGLKAGIYSSPGPFTCGKYTGSWQHEEQDARQFAAWGFDFLKYDWCSYGEIVKNDNSLAVLQKPYLKMGKILKSIDHDIIFNLCQYGKGEVWKWGSEVGGHCWRTSDDLGPELNSFFEVALKNAEIGKWTRPGAWNDPDYIQIGYVGNLDMTGLPELTKLSPTEQYSFMSLWCLLSAPLIYSGDLNRLNDFTLNVLCNTEVIAVDQDPLGKCATVINRDGNTFVMVKELEDGSKAVGLCNKGKTATSIGIEWSELGLTKKKFEIRDLWEQKDLGSFKHQYNTIVPARGVVLIKVFSHE